MSDSEFKFATLSKMSAEKLVEKFAFLKKELFNLRFQKVSGELKNTSRFSKVRKNVARVKTELTARKQKGNKADA